jgi:hypothetical protein
MQYLLYYVVCFIVGDTTKDVFAVVVVDVTLANRRVLK